MPSTAPIGDPPPSITVLPVGKGGSGQITTNVTPPDWKHLRERARAQALEATLQGLQRITDIEAEIDHLIVELRDDLDMTIVDIATDTGMTPAIVTKRYARGKGEG